MVDINAETDIKSRISSREAEELEEFKQLINDNQIECRMDDPFLLAFLRARKYDKERALTLLKNYYNVRRRFTDIFTDLNPTACKEILDAKTIQFLPHKDHLGRSIGVGRVDHWDISRFSWQDVLRCAFLFGDFEMSDHDFQLNGIVILIDEKNITWKHLLQFTPRAIYTTVTSSFGAFPVRFKEFHAVNVNKIFQVFIALFTPFLPYKIRKRIHLHGSDMEKLHEFIPAKYLPAEFGGDLPSFDPTECNEKLKENEDFFIENEKYWKVNKEN